MEKDELLIRELSELIGIQLEYSSDKICELAAEGRVVVLRYRPSDDDWLYFGIVSESEDEQPREILTKALEMNLFGGETSGLHLGLFGNSLVLSGSVSMDGLTAENFAEKILFLSRHVGKITEKLNGEDVAGDALPENENPTPWSAGFMQV